MKKLLIMTLSAYLLAVNVYACDGEIDDPNHLRELGATPIGDGIDFTPDPQPTSNTQGDGIDFTPDPQPNANIIKLHEQQREDEETQDRLQEQEFQQENILMDLDDIDSAIQQQNQLLMMYHQGGYR